MKIARKVTLSLLPVIVLVHAAFAALWLGQEVGAVEEDIARDQLVLGRELATVAGAAYARDGRPGVSAAVRDADRAEGKLHVRWTSLDGARATGASEAAIDRLQRGEPAPWLDTHRRRFVTWIPLPGVPDLVVEVSESLGAEIAHVERLALELAGLSAVLILVEALVAWAIGEAQIGGPVDRLIAKARRIGSGDFTAPVALVESGEIGALGAAIDAMADDLARGRSELERATAARLAALDQLKHAERLATVGTLAAGVAHELGTPLNVVIARARLIAADERVPADVADDARIVAEQGERMATIIRGMLDFARQSKVQVGRVELVGLARRARDLLAPFARRRRATVLVEEGPPAEVTGDGEQLLQVITNLVVNALQAGPEGGTVRVRVVTADRPGPADVSGERWIGVAVTDEGPGVPPDVAQRVFEPFYTTKDVGEGTGLGLAISWGIAREHAGFIDLSGGPGACTFTLFLPRGSP